jgi:hypothetical protein
MTISEEGELWLRRPLPLLAPANPSSLAVDTSLRQLRLDEEGLRVIEMPGSLLDQSFLTQLWLLKGCVFVWMGVAGAAPQMASLSTAIATRYSPMPLVTAVVGAPEMEEQQMAQRLARRTGRQCFVSCQLPDHIPELFAYVEKQVTKRLMEEGVVAQK